MQGSCEIFLTFFLFFFRIYLIFERYQREIERYVNWVSKRQNLSFFAFFLKAAVFLFLHFMLFTHPVSIQYKELEQNNFRPRKLHLHFKRVVAQI